MNINELEKLIKTSLTFYSTTQIIVNLLVTIVLSMLLYWTYKKTYTGVLYSKNFNITIMLITLVTSMIIMIISGNLVLSLGMVGALSIIRFRSAVKDPKDIGFLFWGIAIGLATGTGSYLIATLGSIIIAIVMILVHIKKFDDSAYLLIIKGQGMNIGAVELIVKTHVKKYRLRMRNTLGTEQEIIYEVNLKNHESALIEQLESMESTKIIHLVTYNGEVNN